jgi:hypothetical protein
MVEAVGDELIEQVARRTPVRTGKMKGAGGGRR